MIKLIWFTLSNPI